MEQSSGKISQLQFDNLTKLALALPPCAKSFLDNQKRKTISMQIHKNACALNPPPLCPSTVCQLALLSHICPKRKIKWWKWNSFSGVSRSFLDLLFFNKESWILPVKFLKLTKEAGYSIMTGVSNFNPKGFYVAKWVILVEKLLLENV